MQHGILFSFHDLFTLHLMLNPTDILVEPIRRKAMQLSFKKQLRKIRFETCVREMCNHDHNFFFKRRNLDFLLFCQK